MLFNDASPESIIQRLDFAGGAIQVAVLMPPGMDLDGLELTLNGRKNTPSQRGEAVQDTTIHLTMETAFRVVEV